MSKIPDQIRDVRVRLPAGMLVHEVIGVPRGAHSPRCVLDIEACYPAIDRPPPKPVIFEVGQIFRKRIDNLEKHCEALQARLESIETCCQEGVLGELIRERIFKNETASIKRVFKGGWVNVYVDAAGPYWTRPCHIREDADAEANESAERRIACIQIPDITEGEGL